MESGQPYRVTPLPRFGASISVSIAGDLSLPSNEQVRQLAGAATLAGAQFIQAKWQEAAANGIDGIPAVNSRRYIQGVVAGLEYPYGDELHARVVNDWRIAPIIEEGYKAYDMLPGLLASPQARRGKDGKTYIIVPFRWGTPRSDDDEAGSGDQRATLRSMPHDVYALVGQMKRSRVASAYVSTAADPNERNRPAHPDAYNRRAALFSGGAAQTGSLRRTYEWGDRLGLEELKGIQNAQLYAGMVRMEKGEGTRNVRSHYLTFRVASEKQRGTGAWRHPGQAARPISRAVAEKYASDVSTIMRAVVGEGIS